MSTSRRSYTSQLNFARFNFSILIAVVCAIANFTGCDTSTSSHGSQHHGQTDTPSVTKDQDTSLLTLLTSKNPKATPQPELVLPSVEETEAATEDLQKRTVQLSEVLAGIDQIIQAAIQTQKDLLEKELTVSKELLNDVPDDEQAEGSE